MTYDTDKARDAVVDLLKTYFTDYVDADNIFRDQPELGGLKDTDFPRVGMKHVSEDGKVYGAGSQSGFDHVRLQIDVWVQKDTAKTINGTDYQGEDLCDKLARAMEWTIKQNFLNVSDLDNYEKINIRKPEFDEEAGLYRGFLDARFTVWDNTEVT